MAGDPHWDKVVLAMHMDGANASTVFTDLKGKIVTAVGNAHISTVQSKFGGASAKFDGTWDYLTTPDSPDFDFGAGDFTIESFGSLAVLPASDVYMAIASKDWDYSGSTRGWFFGLHNNAGVHRLVFVWSGEGSSMAVIEKVWSGSSINSMIHFRVVRNGTALTAYVNGVGGTPGTISGSIYHSTNPLSIGSGNPAAINPWFLNGYIDDLLITKGLARCTSNFTPPTLAFPNGQAIISGTVKDDAGAFCARTVRAYDRVTGLLSGSTVSNASTGAFTVITQTLNPHTVIVLDDDVGTQHNALVLDKIMPL